MIDNAIAQEAEIPSPVVQDEFLLSSKKEFHPTNSDPESALNAVLSYDTVTSQDRRYGDLMEYVVGYPDRQTDFDHLYDQLFSKKLINSWREAEKEQVQRDCDGQYIHGEQCGLGFDPLLCAQDISEVGYLYRTEYQTEQSAVITYAWAGDWKGRKEAVASFILVNQNGHWVLDGVNCLDRVRFNWPQ